MKHSAGYQRGVPAVLWLHDPFMVVGFVWSKSAILITTGSVREIKILAGLMSRWTNSFE